MYIKVFSNLVLIYLEEYGVENEAGCLSHVESLLCLGQPVNSVLQGGLETCCQRDSFFQFSL